MTISEVVALDHQGVGQVVEYVEGPYRVKARRIYQHPYLGWHVLSISESCEECGREHAPVRPCPDPETTEGGW